MTLKMLNGTDFTLKRRPLYGIPLHSGYVVYKRQMSHVKQCNILKMKSEFEGIPFWENV